MVSGIYVEYNPPTYVECSKTGVYKIKNELKNSIMYLIRDFLLNIT